MIINHNIPALNTYSRLSSNNQGVSKALEKLSSGMRINRAADDAAGLAISEKMRSQIRGLQQATRNVQDGISLIQTAEGALSEDHAILQRIRELTIQAANDTYTANDRMEIQKEIDQLRNEMDRIASTTQFNAKNLLDGSCAALVSTDKSTTRVFMRGGIRGTEAADRGISAAGNYKLDIVATPGKNQIQKTDIFKINRSTAVMTDLSSPLNGGLTGVDNQSLPLGDYTITTYADIPGATDAAVTTHIDMQYTQGARTTSGQLISPTGIDVDDANAYNASVLMEVTAVDGDNITFKITSHEYGLDGTYEKHVAENVTVTADNAAHNLVVGNLTGFSVTLSAPLATNVYTVGDKAAVNVSAATGLVTDETDNVTIQGPTANVSRTIVFNEDTVWTNSTVPVTTEIKTFYIDSTTGNVSDATHSLTVGPDALADIVPPATAAATFSVEGGGIGDVAKLDTRLYNIDKFWDANGNFLLERPKTITLVQGNGDKINVVLTSADTIGTLRDKLNTAIKTDQPDGLGQSKLVGGPPNDENFVSFVPDPPPQTEGLETVPGTLIIRSGMTGKDGEINIVGDDGLIKALSLMTLQNSESNSFSVTVTDAHDSTKIIAENVVVTDNNLVGIVHDNVDVQFSANTGLVGTWDNTARNFKLTGGEDNQEETFIHLADSSMIFQVGANQQQDVMAAIGDMSVRSLGMENYQVSNNYLANQALARVDDAIARVSAERSKLGAIQNRLDHTFNNLTVTAENLTAAESRIRDVDMAQEMLNFTKYNILSQASTAMLAQANQLPQSVLQLLR